MVLLTKLVQVMQELTRCKRNLHAAGQIGNLCTQLATQDFIGRHAGAVAGEIARWSASELVGNRTDSLLRFMDAARGLAQMETRDNVCHRAACDQIGRASCRERV